MSVPAPGRVVVLSGRVLDLLVGGRARVVKGRRVKFGKYKIVRRYVKVRDYGCESEGAFS